MGERITRKLLSISWSNTMRTHCLYRISGGLKFLVFWCTISLASCIARELVQVKKLLPFWSNETGIQTQNRPLEHITYLQFIIFALHGFLFRVVPSYSQLFLPVITDSLPFQPWYMFQTLKFINFTPANICKTEP